MKAFWWCTVYHRFILNCHKLRKWCNYWVKIWAFMCWTQAGLCYTVANNKIWQKLENYKKELLAWRMEEAIFLFICVNVHFSLTAIIAAISCCKTAAHHYHFYSNKGSCLRMWCSKHEASPACGCVHVWSLPNCIGVFIIYCFVLKHDKHVPCVEWFYRVHLELWRQHPSLSRTSYLAVIIVTYTLQNRLRNVCK